VRSYTPGLICIGDRDFSDSVIVTASALIERWRPRRMPNSRPSISSPCWPAAGSPADRVRRAPGLSAPELLAALYAARLGFEIMATGAACRTYNVLVAEGRAVAARLMIE